MSILRPVDCPKCGAPLPEEAVYGSITTCPFCEATLAVEPGVVFAAAYRRAAAMLDDEARSMPNVVRVGDVPYSIEGRLARGESCDVFVARRARRLTERVLLKILRSHADEDLLARERTVLQSLAESTTDDAPHFTRLVPSIVQVGHVLDRDGEKRPTTVLRFASGFVPTLARVREVFSSGVDPHAAVWMWRRALEVLDWAHRSGWAHGAILPQHLVVHPRDHGVMIVGWTCASRDGEKLPALVDERRGSYPSDVASFGNDVTMSARAVAFVLGGDAASGAVPSSVPRPIAEIVREVSSGSRRHDARSLCDAVGAAAREAFGPPAYVPFDVPS